MNPVVVRNVSIGEGIPKICVPIVGRNEEAIYAQAEQIRQLGADLVEWRADWYEDIFRLEAVEMVLMRLRSILGEIPLLFTFRSAKEGGEREIDELMYVGLIRFVIDQRLVDLIDIEAAIEEEGIRTMIEDAHQVGVKVIVSNHDFYKTPDKKELIQRMKKMQMYGADIPKIAVMPRSAEDVLTLLEATQEMKQHYADRPIITISMAKQGAISRICGEFFGSAVTFATAECASAPGQIPVGELRELLEKMHRYI